MIKTVTLTGSELKVEGLNGFNTFVQNLGRSVIYASKYPGISAGADNVAEIPAGGGKLISTTNGTVYLLGTGKAELTGLDGEGVIASGGAAVYSVSSSDGASLAEFMSYADAQDEATLDAAKEYAEQLAEGKADKSEIPTALPANGGDADTVGGFTVGCDVPADAVFTDTVVDISGKLNAASPVATGSFSLNRKEDTTIGDYSSAVGYRCVASGDYTTATGFRTTASKPAAFSEGEETNASHLGAHAEGYKTTASGKYSHAEGYETIASGENSHASGFITKATNFASFVCGKYSSDMANGGHIKNQTGDVFVVGNGYRISENGGLIVTSSNAFRVTYSGEVYGTGEFNTTGADYAEYIKPWFDDNPDGEDRVGYFVTIKNEKLCFAEPGDYIVGITSGNPSVVGNGDENWLGRWQRDEFSRIIREDVEEEVERFDEETGEVKYEKTGKILKNARFKENPDYDPTMKYVERKNRPEWDYVGMIGVVPLRDDGSCVPGGFAKCGAGGIATKADAWECHKTFFVIERVTENVVKVEMR